MILFLIPFLIVAAGAGLYALFTSRPWQIILVSSIVLWGVFSHVRQGGPTSQDQMAQIMNDVQTHRDQWAVEDALWAKQHH